MLARESGVADELFWNSMATRGGSREGSGGYTWITGWINIFFPYINDRPNQFCVPYEEWLGYVKQGLEERYYSWSATLPPGTKGPDTQVCIRPRHARTCLLYKRPASCHASHTALKLATAERGRTSKTA